MKGKVKSKGNEINYDDQLSCQNYLLPNKILTFHEQKLIFSYRSRMNKLMYNQPGNKQTELCQCGEIITNEHLYYCIMLNEGIIRKDKYEQIFNGSITEQKIIINILDENMKKTWEVSLGSGLTVFEPLVTFILLHA